MQKKKFSKLCWMHKQLHASAISEFLESTHTLDQTSLASYKRTKHADGDYDDDGV